MQVILSCFFVEVEVEALIVVVVTFFKKKMIKNKVASHIVSNDFNPQKMR